MRKSWFQKFRQGIITLVVLAMLPIGALASPLNAAAQAGPSTGIVCTYGPTFTLAANDGHIVLGDGNTMYMWGYSVAGQPFQHPGPVLCVNQGDTVTVVLQNTLSEPVSIIFPGQEGVTANGMPVQPEFNGSEVTSLTTTAATQGSVTYSFVAGNPGTYIYESGTDPEKQVRMGLFGALIVRPSMGADYAYDKADTQFTPEEEFMVLLSEIEGLADSPVRYQWSSMLAGRLLVSSSSKALVSSSVWSTSSAV